MSDEQRLDATFFAFRKRDRPFVLTGAAIAYFILALVMACVFLALTWTSWAQIMAWYFEVMRSASSGSEPSAPPQGALLALAPFYALALPAGLLLFAMFEAACLRWLVRGEAGGGLLGLKLDADTWRVFGVYLAWIAYFFVAVIAIGVFYGVLVALSSLGPVVRFIAILVGALAPVGIGALLIWGGVSFAPAAAASVGRKKFSFFAAPKVVGKRYWPLLTSFFLVIVGYLAVATIVSTIVQMPIQQAMAPIMSQAMAGGDVMALLQETFTTPLMLSVFALQIVSSLILGNIYYVAMFGVNARAFEAAVEAGDAERAA